MKSSRILILISALAIFGSALANASEYKRYPGLGQNSYDIQIERPTPLPRLASTVFRVVHTCRTEGYQCASGTSCELVMSRGYRNKYGSPLNVGSSNNLHFYSCNGSARKPQCSDGFIPVNNGNGYKCMYFR